MIHVVMNVNARKNGWLQGAGRKKGTFVNTNQVRARPLFEDAGAVTLGIRPCHFYFEIPKSRVHPVFTSPFLIIHLPTIQD